MSGSPTFIEKHGLWSDEQKRLAAEIARRVEAEELRFVRVAWGDAHGYSRAKTLTVPAFLSALTDGYNIGVATTTLDSAGARVFASFNGLVQDPWLGGLTRSLQAVRPARAFWWRLRSLVAESGEVAAESPRQAFKLAWRGRGIIPVADQ